MRPPVRLLLVLEVLAVLLLAGRTTAVTPVFGSGDEGYHLDYAAAIAEGRGIPVVGVTPVRPEVRAVQSDLRLDEVPPPPEVLDFGSTSYEAFQPPLYYALAAPLVLLRDDTRERIAVLRGAGVVLVAVTAGLLWLLCRRLRPDRPEPLYALSLLPLATPAFREQVLLVSNDVLLVPLSVLLGLAALRTARRRDLTSLALAAVVVGLLLLTKLTAAWSLLLLLALGVLVLRRQATWRGRLAVPALLAVPVVLLSPWLLLNLSRYGALTASAVVARLQETVVAPVPPVGLVDQLAHLPAIAVQLVLGRRDPHPAGVEVLAAVASALLLVGALAVLLLRRSRRDGSWVLAVALPLQVLLFSAFTVASGTQALYERYLHPAAVLAVVGVGALLLPSGRRRGTVPVAQGAQRELLGQ